LEPKGETSRLGRVVGDDSRGYLLKASCGVERHEWLFDQRIPLHTEV
jgi:hypothetical protein